MEELVQRLIPQQAGHFVFEQVGAADSVDWYELESRGGQIVIRGNNSNSMAVGFNHYLKDYCLVTVSWYAADAIVMPKTLPVLSEKIRVDARCKNRFFLNYCTFGYTMPWWQWNDWERFIDWMALNGINMPLAITGQEAIWYKVWTKMGLTDDEVRNYFTGPAHLPWHRMLNLDYWQGPLPHSWLEHQEKLQQQIVQRERELNMTPILPAFAGHVPKELNRLFPDAKISTMSPWGGFADPYRSHFLDPMDSLFQVIQKEFLTEQTRTFGTDHIYGIDPFNEVAPPSWEPAFLSTAAKTIYGSLASVDSEAIWLQMTWLFYIDRKEWTNERIKAYLSAVPANKLLLLDYYAENVEMWPQTEQYFGQDYIWCYLGNFGGNTTLSGNPKTVGQRIENVYKHGGQHFLGLGSTLEAFDVNPFMYEYVFEKAWNKQGDDLRWIEKLADRHAGTAGTIARQAWRTLYDSIYINCAHLGQGTLTNARPSFTGHGNWTTSPAIAYNNSVLCEIWGQLLQVSNANQPLYSFDVVNIGRQVLGNYFLSLRDKFTKAYTAKDVKDAQQIGQEMLELMNDLDALLATQSTFLLGKWIQDARQFGVDEAEKNYYEHNARTLLTTWGEGNQSLNEYANRSWAGLTKDYYLPRWEMFINEALAALKNGTAFDEKAFHKKVTTLEWEWTKKTSKYAAVPQGNAVEISKRLFEKWQNKIMNNTP
ncbi:alpha-N-acetylglucosaminidase [Bacteroidia bacterium]|nr:alpha-N-acetylglucosaminidase [Bacteroidia bacterium]